MLRSIVEATKAFIIRESGKGDEPSGGWSFAHYFSPVIWEVAQPDAGSNDESVNMFPFLALPYELRLEIYEYLLCSPDPVIISPRRKKLNVGVETVIQGNIFLRAPRPKPCKRVFNKTDHRPHVALLRACRQTNEEGTPILYGKNEFLVGHLIPHPYNHSLSGYYPILFFLWSLRQSTLNDITSITFRKACFCPDWVAFDDKEWSTDGAFLRRKCFPPITATSHLLPATANLRPTPKAAKDTFSLINDNILTSMRPGFWICHKCKERFGAYYP